MSSLLSGNASSRACAASSRPSAKSIEASAQDALSRSATFSDSAASSYSARRFSCQAAFVSSLSSGKLISSTLISAAQLSRSAVSPGYSISRRAMSSCASRCRPSRTCRTNVSENAVSCSRVSRCSKAKSALTFVCRALASGQSSVTSGQAAPVSHLLTAAALTPSRFPRVSCVMPHARRSLAIRAPSWLSILPASLQALYQSPASSAMEAFSTRAPVCSTVAHHPFEISSCGMNPHIHRPSAVSTITYAHSSLRLPR